MTSYQDITRQIGDQWVEALKRAEDSVATATQNVQGAVAKLDVPQIPVPEQLTKLNEAVAERLPKPSEILQANFELSERLLAAQKALALKVLAAVTGEPEAVPSAAPSEAPAKATAKAPAKKSAK
jgi:peptidoglycan hydrolase CwlO-like protein